MYNHNETIHVGDRGSGWHWLVSVVTYRNLTVHTCPHMSTHYYYNSLLIKIRHGTIVDYHQYVKLLVGVHTVLTNIIIHCLY